MTSPDPSAQSGATDPAQSGAGGTGDSGATTDPASGAQGGTGTTPASTDTARSEHEVELEKQRARALAADQRAAAAEAALKQIRDKDLPMIDKLTRDLTEAQEAQKAAEDALRQARIENAFLADNEHEWHNLKRALASLDLGGVDIDKDGNVSGLKAAIAKLAKDEPYLLKPKDAGGAEGDKQPPAGTPPFNTGAPGTDKTGMKEAVQRFPAMRTRAVGR